MERLLFAFSWACCLISIVGENFDVQGVDADHEERYDEEACHSSTFLLQLSLEVAHRSNVTDMPRNVAEPHPRVLAVEPNTESSPRMYTVEHAQRSTGHSKHSDGGLPLHIEALIFGLFSALSLPIGAILGVMFAPMSKAVIAKWLAFGSGALVFAVATEIYGDNLFAMVALSRKYGPFDAGCQFVHGTNICTEKFWGMIQQIVAGIAGAFLYIILERMIRRWFADERDPKDGRWDCDFQKACRPSFDYDDDGIHLRNVGRNPRSVALAMWAGMLLDSIPESLMLGFMTNHHQLRFGFLFAIFLANFPEAFSSAGILQETRMSICCTCSLWSSIFVITGLFAMLGSLMLPEVSAQNILSMNFELIEGLAQGISGGAMLAMMAVVMLPEAYKGAGSIAGVYFVLGFGFSVFVQTLDSYMAGPQYLLHHHIRKHLSNSTAVSQLQLW